MNTGDWIDILYTTQWVCHKEQRTQVALIDSSGMLFRGSPGPLDQRFHGLFYDTKATGQPQGRPFFDTWPCIQVLGAAWHQTDEAWLSIMFRRPGVNTVHVLYSVQMTRKFMAWAVKFE